MVMMMMMRRRLRKGYGMQSKVDKRDDERSIV